MLKLYKESMSLIFDKKNLIIELAKREINDKYVGQVFGRAWALVHPMLIMSVYIFIFVFVFNMKTGGSREVPLDFGTYLIAGLVSWLVVMELLAKSTTAVTANANLVKQVVFPLEILPLKTVFSTFLTMSVFVSILFIYVVVFKQTATLMIFLLPILLYMQIIMMIGLAYILSSIGVYFKDIKDMVQMLGTIGVFILPVMYQPSQLPLYAQPIIYLNPFSYLVFCYQDVFVYGSFEHWYAWIVLFIFSHLVFVFGFSLFRKLKVMFGDVL
jgi:lipopolysaccharide transport system permease protein